jgi:nucleoside-diphosphate-sugar epimerase
MALTVALTGPTGEIGTSVVRALEQEERVDRVLGMARRPFDPASRGWRKTEYRQGDVLDRAAVEALVAEADAVVHLAYLIVGSREESRRINLAGSRNVAGPEATLLARSLPWRRAAERLPNTARGVLGRVASLLPVLPDPGVRFQLIHHDDVATAVCAAVVGTGLPGAYNLAGDGEITMSDFARALGGYAIPVPGALLGLTSTLVGRLPFLPAEMEWVHTARHPMLMDTTKARRELGWAPAHTAHETLAAMVDAERDRAAP